MLSRRVGEFPVRGGDAQFLAVSLQLPQRLTRYEPVAAPIGSSCPLSLSGLIKSVELRPHVTSSRP